MVLVLNERSILLFVMRLGGFSLFFGKELFPTFKFLSAFNWITVVVLEKYQNNLK